MRRYENVEIIVFSHFVIEAEGDGWLRGRLAQLASANLVRGNLPNLQAIPLQLSYLKKT